ncbi:MAG: DUF882 domain-containing protein [Pseudomonadota bacterium]
MSGKFQRENKSLINRSAFRALLALVLLIPFFTSSAYAETRKLKLYFLHTGERAEIAYKKNGRYLPGGLKKINRFLRDWRRNEPTKMDPALLDLIWNVYRETGSRKYIHVISGYRSPRTNNLLRKRGRGVAKKSQHTMGKALDFFIPGVNLRKLRNIGLRQGLGGVGFYPKSGSPFVHMDTGRVRHWPRMSRKELARVFPKGKTLHVPTDGKPLARYNQAKLEYERKRKGLAVRVAKAEEIKKKPSAFAKLFGGRDDDEEGAIGAVTAPKAVKTVSTKAQRPNSRNEDDSLAPINVPKPKATPEVKAPVPAVEVAPEPAPKPEPVPETPATVLAALDPKLLPVPVIAPRVVSKPEEVVEPETDPTADGELPIEELPGPEENTVLAAIPSPRPEFGGDPIVTASLEPAALTGAELPPKPKVAALTPNEIEDLRREVYAGLALKDEKKDEQNPGVQIASLIEEVSSDELKTIAYNDVVIPEPNPGKAASEAIDRQLTSQTSKQEKVDAPVLAVSYAPIEPGVEKTDTLPVPVTNPNATNETPDVKPTIAITSDNETVLAGVNIPVPTPSPVSRTQIASLPVGDATNPNKATAKVLNNEEFKTANLDDRLVGKWALESNVSLSEIADIHPPAYGLNVIRKAPKSVLSGGFSKQQLNSFTKGFTGSSLELLDFTNVK